MIRAWYRFLRERLMAIRGGRTAEVQEQRRLADYVAQLMAEARRQAAVE
jgi:hypothetical protein